MKFLISNDRFFSIGGFLSTLFKGGKKSLNQRPGNLDLWFINLLCIVDPFWISISALKSSNDICLAVQVD